MPRSLPPPTPNQFREGSARPRALPSLLSMKKRITILGSTLIGLVVILVIFYSFTSPTAVARPVQLVITGPEGQRFSGT